MHLDEEQVQRMLHGELPPEAQSLIRAHLDRCDECREYLGQEALQEERIFALLQTIDSPLPVVDHALVMSGSRWRRSVWPRRLAAVAAGLAIATIAYAAPGSPVRALVRRLMPAGAEHAPAPVVGPTRLDAATTAGVAVPPGVHLTIEITAAPSSGMATASLVDGDEVIVRAVGGRPSFRSEADRVVVENAAGVSELTIDIPRSAPFVEIRLSGRRVLRKAGRETTGHGMKDSPGRYVLTYNP
jgi:putative zinc finger protein